MSDTPFMPLFWDSYIADTTHLTCEEHGAYLMLLGAMWRRGGYIPDDDRDNARILSLTPARWKRIKERLRPLLIFENDQISQKKLQNIYEKSTEKIKKNRENSIKRWGGESNKNNDLDDANASDPHVPKPPGRISIPDPDSNYNKEGKPSLTGTPSQIVWKILPEFLEEHGVPPPQSRSLTGKFLKQSNPEAVLAAHEAAVESGTRDPVPFIMAVLRGGVTTEDIENSVDAVFERAET